MRDLLDPQEMSLATLDLLRHVKFLCLKCLAASFTKEISYRKKAPQTILQDIAVNDLHAFPEKMRREVSRVLRGQELGVTMYKSLKKGPFGVGSKKIYLPGAMRTLWASQ